MVPSLAYRLGVSCLLIIASLASAKADSKQATLDVSANVVTACEAGSGMSESGETDFGTLDFGTQYFLSKGIEVVGQPNGGAIRVKCANGISFTVLLDGGQSGNTASRYLINEQGNKVSYNLYTDSSHSTVWDDITGLTVAGNGQEMWLAVYGVIPAQPTPSAGIYTDTIKVTIQW